MISYNPQTIIEYGKRIDLSSPITINKGQLIFGIRCMEEAIALELPTQVDYDRFRRMKVPGRAYIFAVPTEKIKDCIAQEDSQRKLPAQSLDFLLSQKDKPALVA